MTQRRGSRLSPLRWAKSSLGRRLSKSSPAKDGDINLMREPNTEDATGVEDSTPLPDDSTSAALSLASESLIVQAEPPSAEPPAAATPEPDAETCWGFVAPCLRTMGIQSPEEAAKVLTVSFFCFTANTILLLGRNIGATMLLTGLGADALPYVMILVGFFIMIVMPFVAKLAQRYTSRAVLMGTTWLMVATLSAFAVCFTTGMADRFPRVVYPLFFVLEEVIDSLLMVLFWQVASSARLEQKRLGLRLGSGS